MNLFQLTAADDLKLSVALFKAVQPKGLLQIIHGSVEHKERYFDLCDFLCKNGFTVIVSDNRGHGASIDNAYPLGYMDSWQKIVDDQYLISKYIRSLHPELPLYMLGHSLGSVFARCYLEKHDNEIQKLILSGTVYYNTFTPIGILLAKFIIWCSGGKSYNMLLRKLAMNGENIEWVSSSKTNLANYKSDPLCGYAYPNRSILTVFEATRQLKLIHHYLCQNPNLPIMSISGEEDPVTGGKRGLKKTFKLLNQIGYHNFTNKVYPGMRHEVLNEDNHQLVFDDVLQFLSSY